MNAFNTIMRIVSSLIGLVMIAMGAIWILQGLNLAFRVGFMVGERRWVLFGAILALVGIAQIAWSNLRQAPNHHSQVSPKPPLGNVASGSG